MGNGALVGLLGGQENVRSGDATNKDEVLWHIRLKQLHLLFISVILMVWTMFALIASVVPGAATGGPDVSLTSLPKIPFLVVPLCVAMYTYNVASYDITWEPLTAIRQCLVSFYVNVTGALIMYIFTSSCIQELKENESILSQHNHGAWLWAFTIGGGLLAIWFQFLAWRLWVYARDIRNVITRWGPITREQLHAVEMAGTKYDCDGDARKKRESESKKEK
jgi:hypothetical protein